MSTQAFAPFVPSASCSFDRRRAAHLLRRAGFGASEAQVIQAVEKGLVETVDRLFDEAEDEQSEYEKTFTTLNGRLMDFSDAGAVQAWWVYRMSTTRAPLREKLTLFWHGHFATSHEKVEDMQLMHRQIETIRRHAWGNVRDLVLAVARDPAMLVWLDGESSTKDHPNENFARELMELFTCGIGHYAESDVQEAARAFTGWGREGAEFVSRAENHDPGLKRFLDKSGRFDGTDIVDILMQQPATPRFLARKLLRFFAAPEPAEDVVAEAAELLDRTRLNLKWFLRDLFLSRYFYSDVCHRARISSPAELVVGTVRTLGVRWAAPELRDRLQAMGQELLAPPNVKGWDGERKWINSTTWTARVDFASTIANLNGDDGGFNARLDIDSIVPTTLAEPGEVVDRLAEVMLQGDLSVEARRDLIKYLTAAVEGGGPETIAKEPIPLQREKIPGALGLLMSLPEYHAY